MIGSKYDETKLFHRAKMGREHRIAMTKRNEGEIKRTWRQKQELTSELRMGRHCRWSHSRHRRRAGQTGAKAAVTSSNLASSVTP